jgi:hypothetical protein
VGPEHLLLEVPLLAYVFAPECTHDTVNRFKAWMGRTGHSAAVIGAGVIGLVLVVRGLSTLLLSWSDPRDRSPITVSTVIVQSP